MKKNPLLSMWLSGFHLASNSARGLAMAEMHRQSAAMLAEGTRQATQFWTDLWLAPFGAGRKAPRRRR
jgi:hypothetical protein